MTVAPEQRVCPTCGTTVSADDRCAGCGIDLSALTELPTRSQWEARAPRPSAGSIKPLLHPTEPTRLALALTVVAIALAVLLVFAVVLAKAGALGYAIGIAVFLVGSIWLAQQLLNARLLGRSVRVGADTMPELQAMLDDVRSTLDYHKRIDIYVVDKNAAPIGMSTYLGTRIIVIEGGLVAELMNPGGRPQLKFLIGRSIGSLRAKHARLNLIVVLLASFDALKYISPFLRPWYRATVYSGDQIGMACCSDLEASLQATRRLLVGKELAAEMAPGNVLPQACLVQQKLLPRLVQLLATEPHVTNRYANLICFARYHDPVLWERLRAMMPPAEQAAVDRLWARSPYSRRVTTAPSAAVTA